mmetsp:Transcript_1729/g.3817  ORF Transcript_1729/g.3817 Transcript_1729/m.3817 type:complete len:148 (-) Transcript_1729:1278-1721(-)
MSLRSISLCTGVRDADGLRNILRNVSNESVVKVSQRAIASFDRLQEHRFHCLGHRSNTVHSPVYTSHVAPIVQIVMLQKAARDSPNCSIESWPVASKSHLVKMTDQSAKRHGPPRAHPVVLELQVFNPPKRPVASKDNVTVIAFHIN